MTYSDKTALEYLLFDCVHSSSSIFSYWDNFYDVPILIQYVSILLTAQQLNDIPHPFPSHRVVHASFVPRPGQTDRKRLEEGFIIEGHVILHKFTFQRYYYIFSPVIIYLLAFWTKNIGFS